MVTCGGQGVRTRSCKHWDDGPALSTCAVHCTTCHRDVCILSRCLVQCFRLYGKCVLFLSASLDTKLLCVCLGLSIPYFKHTVLQSLGGVLSEISVIGGDRKRKCCSPCLFLCLRSVVRLRRVAGI